MTQPAWLANWQPQPTKHRSGPQVAPKAAVQSAPAKPKANYQGFIEPRMWPQDDGARREPVLDTDLGRVVRYVGWRKCMRCGQLFWSEDVLRLRLCTPQPNRQACRNRQDDDGI